MAKDELLAKFGPSVGNGGDPWDDAINDTVKKVVICSGDVINSIQVTYEKFGKEITKPKHGGSGGTATVILLDYPNEYLTKLSGYYGSDLTGINLVQSLTLKSNKRDLGTFGTKNGTPFESSSNYGKIVGFLGRSGKLLDSVGAYFTDVST